MITAKAGAVGFTPTLIIKGPDSQEIKNDTNPEVRKYEQLWGREDYREKNSPGEDLVGLFLKQINAKKGETVIDFGCGPGRASFLMSLLGGLKVILLDFADNCLDKDVENALITQSHVLSFIKHDLEKPIPVAAKYGYCTDVMEHIPEDKVDIVLNNILKSAEKVFFNIATRPDEYGAKIGEKLHLTVKPFSWWLNKFRERGATVYWSEEIIDGNTGNDFCAFFYVSSWNDAKELVNIGIVNTVKAEILDNIKTNIKRPVNVCQPYEKQDTPIMILGGGPTLEQYWDEIAEKRKKGLPLITTNGAYNECIKRGIAPSGQVIVDAREFNNRFTAPIIKDCKYFLASQCHPSVFDAIPSQMTYIFHATSGSSDEVNSILNEYYNSINVPYFLTPGGSTAILRSFVLFRMLGFWKFETYGFDSCLREDKHHAYSQPENDEDQIIKVSCGSKIFKCTPWMASQAQEFIDQVKAMGDEVEIDVAGDGLISHIIKTGAELEDLEPVQN